MTTTERTVILNSRFRASGTSTDFTVLLNKAVAVDDVDRIIVKRVFMPNLFYNVPTRKSKLYLRYEGTLTSVTMTPGQYNVDRFAAELQLLLQAIDISATVTVDYDTAKFTLSYSGATAGWTVFVDSSDKDKFTSNILGRI